MGRHCGDIALYAGIAGGAEVVLLPEVEMPLNEVVDTVNEGIASGKLHNIIIRAEGYPVSSAELIKTLKKETGQDVKLVVLSYLQRGGSPTFRDRMLATDCGMMAVELLSQGITNRAIGEVNGQIVHMDLAKALKAKRTLRDELFHEISVLSK